MRECSSRHNFVLESDWGNISLVETIFENCECGSCDNDNVGCALTTFVDVNFINLGAFGVFFSGPDTWWLLQNIFEIPKPHRVIWDSAEFVVFIVQDDLGIVLGFPSEQQLFSH